MISINRVSLAGWLVADPVLRFSPAGRATVRLLIRTEQRWQGADGIAQDKSETHVVVYFDAAAQEIGKRSRKGDALRVEGSLSSRVWTDRRQREHRSMEVVGSAYEFVERQTGLFTAGEPA